MNVLLAGQEAACTSPRRPWRAAATGIYYPASKRKIASMQCRSLVVAANSAAVVGLELRFAKMLGMWRAKSFE